MVTGCSALACGREVRSLPGFADELGWAVMGAAGGIMPSRVSLWRVTWAGGLEGMDGGAQEGGDKSSTSAGEMYACGAAGVTVTSPLPPSPPCTTGLAARWTSWSTCVELQPFSTAEVDTPPEELTS